MKNVLLANNIGFPFPKEKHGGVNKHYNWFTQTFVDQSIQHQMATKGTSSPLYMIIVERHGFISCKKNLKPVFCLKDLKLKLRKNLETPLKSLE